MFPITFFDGFRSSLINFRPDETEWVTLSLTNPFSPQCLDSEGFCLFLKTYLEVDDFPADFCKRLFCYFQHNEQDGSPDSPLPKGGKIFSISAVIWAQSLKCGRRKTSSVVLLMYERELWGFEKGIYKNNVTCFYLEEACYTALDTYKVIKVCWFKGCLHFQGGCFSRTYPVTSQCWRRGSHVRSSNVGFVSSF